jgi:phosphoglycolate phosphatase-like HAD superfamily hydrolase
MTRSATDWNEIRCIAFDFDGTLADSNAIKRDTFFQIFREWSGSAAVIEDVLDNNPKLDRYGVIPLIRDTLARREGERALPPASEFVDAYGESSERRVSACPSIPGAVEALEALNGHYPLYIDSATPQGALVRVVERRGWKHFFRDVLGRPTDKADNLRIIADREKLAPSEILMIGDGPPDVRAAAQFECPFQGFQARDDTLAAHPGLGALGPLVQEIFARSADRRDA